MRLRGTRGSGGIQDVPAATHEDEAIQADGTARAIRVGQPRVAGVTTLSREGTSQSSAHEPVSYLRGAGIGTRDPGEGIPRLQLWEDVKTWHEVWCDYWEPYLGGAAPFGKAIEHVTARLPQQPIAVSDITADRLAEIGPARESIDVVPNGIDVERIRMAPLPESHGHDAYDVLFAGRLIKDKNVALLLDAFNAVANRSDATLGIIGDGPEAAPLQRQAQRLDCADRIDFLGFFGEYDHVLGHMCVPRVCSPRHRPARASGSPTPRRWPPTVP